MCPRRTPGSSRLRALAPGALLRDVGGLLGDTGLLAARGGLAVGVVRRRRTAALLGPVGGAS